MITYLTLSFISTLIIASIINFSKYIQILQQNISLALQPPIQQQLANNPHFKIALDKSVSNHVLYSRIYLPSSLLALLTLLSIWILIPLDIIIPNWLYIPTAILSATSITKLITQEQFPKWFFHWSKLIHATRDEINLQLLRTKLQEVHTKLQEVIDGKQLPETELNQLKFEGLFLSQQADILAKQLDSYK